MHAQRSDCLIDKIEAFCKDTGIVPGREAIDSQVDSDFQIIHPTPISNTAATQLEDNNSAAIIPTSHYEGLDDRATRNVFLRFFCSILEGCLGWIF